MTKDLSIENLCGGAVQERINRALRKVSDNILDVNTEAKKKRSISRLCCLPGGRGERRIKGHGNKSFQGRE